MSTNYFSSGHLSPGLLMLVSIALSLSTFMFVLDYSVANVSIPYISGDLAVSVDQGTYVITSFAVGNAIGLAITGWLTKRVGAVRLICICLLLFTFFSWACGATPNFETLVISRFLQGFVSGPTIPLSQTLILMTHPPKKRAKAMAIWSTVVIAAPVVGPVLGGWLSYSYKWPWIFYINIPIGIISTAVIWFLLKERETPREKAPRDLIGFFFLAVGVSCLQFLLDKGEQYDWLNSYLIRSCAVISLVCFTFLIVWSLTKKDPLIRLRLFKIRTFAISVIFIGTMYALYFGSIILVPLWLQTSMNYTSTWAGIAVAPVGIVPFIIGAFMGSVTKRFGFIKPLALCFILFAISCFYTAYFATNIDILHIAFSRFLMGCGLAFFITPLFALSVQDVPEEKLASATGLFHFVRATMGGVGTSIFTTLLTRRGAFHHARLSESVTPSSTQTNLYLDKLHDLLFSKESALEFLNVQITNQAAMLSLNDCFFLMGWLFLGMLILLPFGRTKPSAAKQASSSMSASE